MLAVSPGKSMGAPFTTERRSNVMVMTDLVDRPDLKYQPFVPKVLKELSNGDVVSVTFKSVENVETAIAIDANSPS